MCRREDSIVESGGKNGRAVPPEKVAGLSVPQRLLVATFAVVGVWYLAWRPATFNPDAMLFSVISVPRSLDSETRRRALEVGPPFVDSERPYPEMLSSTGWRVLKVRDVTIEYHESLCTLVKGFRESRALEAALGHDGVAESIGHRRSQIASIERGALVREVFLATAV